MTAFVKVKKKKKGTGVNNQPTKLDKKRIDDIVKCLRAGAYIETACVMAGIAKKTFYEYIKESHSKRRTKHAQLCRELRNAVALAQEEATMRDLMNIDKAAMGRKPKYDRYPENTIIPARNAKGDVQTNRNTGEPVMIDVSGQIVTDFKGNPIIAEEGLAPSYQCSMWRLEKRRPKDWGATSTLFVNRPDPTENVEEKADPNKMEIIFVDSEYDIQKKKEADKKVVSDSV